MKTLVIAEKPELAEAIAQGYSDNPRKTSFFFDVGNDTKVIWCYGHMLEFKKPEDYDSTMTSWSMERLPYEDLLKQELKVSEGKERQLNKIIELAKEADLIIHAGDPDPEGQLIIDEILTYADIKAPVKRLKTNDNSKPVIRKAINQLTDNKDSVILGEVARARSIADLISGLNMTGAYSVKYKRLLVFGRVSTPILSLIVSREREREAFKAVSYAEAEATFKFSSTNLDAKMILPESFKNEDGIIVDQTHINELKKIIADVKTSTAEISENTNELKHKKPPLLYNSLRLQIECSQLFGYSPDKVLEITQSLREKHKAITYNRSSSRYLNDESFEDVPYVIETILKNLSDDLDAKIPPQLDSSKKGRVFNSKKVTAHHAIIPTQTVLEEKLSLDEERVYNLIAKRYLAQFMPDREYYLRTIKIDSNGHQFIAQAQVEASAGWKVLIEDEDEDESDSKINLDGSDLYWGNAGSCTSASVKMKKTRAPQLYTDATLSADLVQIAKYVKDPELKQALIDKDKDSEDEKGSIGTEATRPPIIKNLFERGYLIKKGKSIVSSEEAKIFYDLLPEDIKTPDLTARWQLDLNAIENGELSVDSFIAKTHADIAQRVELIKDSEIVNPFNDVICECGGIVKKYKGKNADFWSCDQFDTCSIKYEEINGKPSVIKTIPCECGGTVTKFFGKDRSWWSCDQFDTCSIKYEEVNGEPKKKVFYPCECGGSVYQFDGKNGKFWNCDQFETCTIRYEEVDGKPSVIKTIPCECGGTVTKFFGKNGAFWGCDQRDTCTIRYEEVDGRPQKKVSYPCECGGSVYQFDGKNGKFWNCDQFETCTIRYEEVDGRPQKKVSYPCECGGSVYQFDGKNGKFWGCDQRDTCTIRYEEVDGRPQKKVSYPCECGGSVYQFDGKNGKFWNCDQFETCTIRYEEVDGRPQKKVSYPCECGGSIYLVEGKKGEFWSCDNYKKCNTSYIDSDGQPVKEKTLNCECGGVVKKMKKKKGDGHFWSCSNFKKCDHKYEEDDDGNPYKSQ